MGLFLQTLQSDRSCQAIAHQFRQVAQKNHNKVISSSTSAYCQARQRLPNALLDDIFSHSHRQGDSFHPLVNRRVVCADGTGLTAEEQPSIEPSGLNKLAKSQAVVSLNYDCAVYSIYTPVLL